MAMASPTGAADAVVARTYTMAPTFTFQKHRGKLDWRKMAKIDLDRVGREVCLSARAQDGMQASLAGVSEWQVDIDTLEAHLENLAFRSLTEEGVCFRQ